jgi:hypothetical protein
VGTSQWVSKVTCLCNALSCYMGVQGPLGCMALYVHELLHRSRFGKRYLV